MPRPHPHTLLAPLDTTNTSAPAPAPAPTHRYSFLATPIEHQGPFTPSQRARTRDGKTTNADSDGDAHADADRSSNSNTSIEDVTTTHLSTVVEEASPRSATATAANMSAMSASPPPLSEHPANFIAVTSPPQTATTAHFPPTSPPPGAHPHPHPHIPRPTYSEAQQFRREKEWGVVPDDNPLAAHTSTTTKAAHTDKNPQLGRTTTAGQHASHLPGQIRHPNQAVKGGTWSHGLCNPTDPGTCCVGLFCPCILYGKTQYRLSQRAAKRDATNLLGYETCNASCAAMALLLCGCQCILSAIQHARVRRAYSIPGSIPSDCVRATCCMCCTLVQDEREVKTREESAAGVSGNVVSVPYAAPGGMAFGPPPR